MDVEAAIQFLESILTNHITFRRPTSDILVDFSVKNIHAFLFAGRVDSTILTCVWDDSVDPIIWVGVASGIRDRMLTGADWDEPTAAELEVVKLPKDDGNDWESVASRSTHPDEVVKMTEEELMLIESLPKRTMFMMQQHHRPGIYLSVKL